MGGIGASDRLNERAGSQTQRCLFLAPLDGRFLNALLFNSSGLMLLGRFSRWWHVGDPLFHSHCKAATDKPPDPKQSCRGLFYLLSWVGIEKKACVTR